MVDFRIYPLLLRIRLINIFLFLIFWIKPTNYPSSGSKIISNSLFIGVLIVLFFCSLFFWLHQTSQERNFFGLHSFESKITFKLGIIIFIVSEVCFFFSFFWAYFHRSLRMDLNTGLNWPSTGIDIVNPFSIPLINSIILIRSGLRITIGHYECFIGNRRDSFLWLTLTIFLGWLFIFLQLFEYNILTYSLRDSIFGRIFFLGTGFHGLHVLVGRVMLSWILIKLYFNFSLLDLVRFEISIWYWHFVDVVWLFLYFWFYWWPK